MTLYIDTIPELQWSNWNNETWMCNDDYVIKWHNNKRKFILLDERKVNVIIECETIDEAKAAAQADYERRTAERFRKVELPDSFDADEFLNSLDIYHHPYITDRTDTESYEVSDLMARFVGHIIAKAKEATL